MIRTQKRLEYVRGYLDLGMVTDARTELEAIHKDDWMKPEVLGVRVIYALSAREWGEMAELSRTLAQKIPEDPQWWIHWAYALREQEFVQAAQKIAQRGLELHPKEAILHFNLACYLSLLGQTDEASDHLNLAIGIDERFQEASVSDPDLEALWNSFKE